MDFAPLLVWLKGALPRFLGTIVAWCVGQALVRGFVVSEAAQAMLLDGVNVVSGMLLAYMSHKVFGITFNPNDGSSPGSMEEGKAKQLRRKELRAGGMERGKAAEVAAGLPHAALSVPHAVPVEASKLPAKERGPGL